VVGDAIPDSLTGSGGDIARGRALLVDRLGFLRATRTASLVGKAFALIFLALGIVTGNLLLMLVAWFVYAGAQHEMAQVEAKEVLGSMSVADLLQQDGPAIDSRATLADAADFTNDLRVIGPPKRAVGGLFDWASMSSGLLDRRGDSR